MPANIGTQTISVKYYDPVDSNVVNQRFAGVRDVGIYSGGYLTKIGGSGCSISPIILEIADTNGESYQIRAATANSITITPAEATPYIIARWIYTGSASADYVAFLAVSSPNTFDVVLGKAIYLTGSLVGFVDGDFSYQRTVPGYIKTYLKVSENSTPSSTVQISSGRIHSGSAGTFIFAINLNLSSYTTGQVVYIYVTDTGITTHSATASAYVGKILLAKITMPADKIIEDSDIIDVRAFLTPPAIPDGTTLQRDTTTGKLSVRAVESRSSDPSSPITGQIWFRNDL